MDSKKQAKRIVKIVATILWFVFCFEAIIIGIFMLFSIFRSSNVEKAIVSIVATLFCFGYSVGGFFISRAIANAICKNIDKKADTVRPITYRQANKQQATSNEQYIQKENHEHINPTYDHTLQEHQTEAKISLLCPRCGESFFAPISQNYTRCPKCHKKLSIN